MTREEMKDKAIDLLYCWGLIIILISTIIISCTMGYISMHRAEIECGVLFMIEVAYSLGLSIEINEDGESWFDLAFEVVEENK